MWKGMDDLFSDPRFRNRLLKRLEGDLKVARDATGDGNVEWKQQLATRRSTLCPKMRS
jgi:hypothetical protein